MFSIFNTSSEPFCSDANGIHYLGLSVVYRSHILPLNIQERMKIKPDGFYFHSDHGCQGRALQTSRYGIITRTVLMAVSVMGFSEVQGRYSAGGCYLSMRKGR